MEKLEKEKKKETKQFLNQIRRRPRFAQIFVDQYSLRDENVNKNIIEINKHLGRNLYEKKNMNLKIDKYLDLIENNKLKEEEYLNTENSYDKEQIILQQMMLKNLEFDEEMENHYNKMGTREKEEILALVKKGRIEKNKEQTFKEDFELFQDFKQHVLKKEKMVKEINRTQFRNPYGNNYELKGEENLGNNEASKFHENLNELNGNDLNSKLNNEIINSYNNIYEDNRKINEEEYKREIQRKYGSVSSMSNKTSDNFNNNNEKISNVSKNNITEESNSQNHTQSNKNFNLPPIDIHNSSNNSKRSSKKSVSTQNKNFNNIESSKSKNIFEIFFNFLF